MGLAVLPRRDAEAPGTSTGGLATRPLVLARDRAIGLADGLAGLVPGGALTRGAVVRVAGSRLRAGTATGSVPERRSQRLGRHVGGGARSPLRSPRWGSGPPRSTSTARCGALAAAEAGVALERFAVVRRVPPARWATVVAALLDGVSLVLADVPRGVGLGDARRLLARARERETVLVVLEHDGRWPAEAALTMRATGGTWDLAAGHLVARAVHVVVEGRGAAARPVAGELAARGLTPARSRPAVPARSRRVCAVWCPDWPVVAARVRDPSLVDAPIAVVERGERGADGARGVDRGAPRRRDARVAPSRGRSALCRGSP